MSAAKVHLEIINRTGILTIDHPPANALSPELRNQLIDQIKTLERDDAVWTLIITSVGNKFFMAGADIPGLLALDAQTGLERVKASRVLYSTCADCPKPVIAAINGMCLGGGFELALACDIRVAADHVKVGVPEVNLGLIPGGGGTQRLPRLTSPGWANYLMFTGEAISAQRAMSLGLFQEVVPLDELRDETLRIASKINAKGPLAVRACKKSARLGLNLPMEQALDLENQLFGEVCGTLDKNEGVQAFLDKRKPVFQGK